MELSKFKKDSERQIHKSFNELFDKAKLSQKERDIYYRYRDYCEYWLLRSKLQYSQSEGQNFLKRLAIVLINLQSKNVSGPKDSVVKQMFGDKSVHRCYPTKNGLRSTKNSNIIENTYFELEILSFFLLNNFDIQLANDNIKGKKIPEFKAELNGAIINIEAKQLDVEKIMDNIFGDGFTSGINSKLSEKELDSGYKRIFSQFERNYSSAISKYLEIEPGEYFIIFLSAYYRIDYLGKYAINFLNDLPKQWTDNNYNNLVGIVIPDSEKTYFIQNRLCDNSIIETLLELGINDFHKYIPTILEPN
ncbi:hypothetical protein [uncultured Draconibacterium sp.]|uniref:hypothetical protein n=1 Tax=uncultured Draconibacterium sp. TaxID=1573823 RepID=UPI0029C72011|nr:hypothetical protein [uncultured Draconibacterium sp.]